MPFGFIKRTAEGDRTVPSPSAIPHAGQWRMYLAVSAIFLQSCFIASQSKMINREPEVVKEAFRQVYRNTRVQFKENPSEVRLYAKLGHAITLREKHIKYPSFYFFSKGGNFMNNTGLNGAVRLIPSGNGTIVESTVATESGDPKSCANLFIELADQQMQLDQGLIDPTVNPKKSGLVFSGENLLMPYWGNTYLMRDNPLISKSMARKALTTYAVLDIAAIGLIIPALFMTNGNAKTGMMGAGISLAGLNRLVTMLNLTDLFDYNKLAGTKYNLRLIRPD